MVDTNNQLTELQDLRNVVFERSALHQGCDNGNVAEILSRPYGEILLCVGGRGGGGTGSFQTIATVLNNATYANGDEVKYVRVLYEESVVRHVGF